MYTVKLNTRNNYTKYFKSIYEEKKSTGIFDLRTLFTILLRYFLWFRCVIKWHCLKVMQSIQINA